MKKQFLMMVIMSIVFVMAASAANDCQMGHIYNESDANQFGYDDYSGMEYSDKYLSLLDPAQCGACPSGVCIDNVNFATVVSFDDTSFSFNVFMCGATDTGGGCYAPNLADIRATAGPFDFIDLAAGSYTLSSGTLTGTEWCVSPVEPVFIGIDWTTPPGSWQLDFLCNSTGCTTCNQYYEDPGSPGSAVDFCNSPNWSNTGSPYIWSEVSCTGGSVDVPSTGLIGLLVLLLGIGVLIIRR